MAEEQQEEADIHRPRELYAYHATSSFATDISMSYFSYFAVRLGASFELLAWMQSLNNLLPNTLQHFWGWISDRRAHRAFWIILGSALGGFALWLLSEAQTPEEVLVLLVLYSASLSLVQPTWAALQGDWIPAGRRGRVLSRFHVVGGMAGLIGSLVALWFVYNSGNETADGFRPLFVMAAAATALGGLILVKVPYRDPGDVPDEQQTEQARIAHSNAFQGFVRVQMVYTLLMSLIWPLFAVLLIRVVGATNTQLVIFSVLGAAAEMAFQPLMGRLVDRVGPLQVMFLSRIGFAVLPFVYVLWQDLWVYYALQVVLFGPCFSAFLVSTNTLILDLAPSAERAGYFSYYNTRIGITTFTGALIGGHLAGFLEGHLDSTAQAIYWVFVISGAGRLLASFPYLRLTSPRRYPASLRLLDRLAEAQRPWRR